MMNEAASHRYPHTATPSQTSSFKQVTVDLTPDEAEQLEKYCSQTGKVATDVIRELIQKFPMTEPFTPPFHTSYNLKVEDSW